MLFIDSDNALGAPCGDVDDGFAIAALLCSGEAVAGLSSVAGNTSEARAYANNRKLADLCGYAGPVLHGGEETARFLAASPEPLRIVALGPLTNVAAGLARGARPAEIVLVGGNASSWGRWPPLWPLEFNLTKDKPAAQAVLAADVPLTVVPLDVARRLRVTRPDLHGLPGRLGEHLRAHSRRWFRRALVVHASRSVPLWDLAAAMLVLEPGLFQVVPVQARMHRNGWLELGAGRRTVELVRDLDPRAVWSRFVQRLSRLEAPAPAPDRD